ncbi:MAG: YgjV family protein [Clostridia bacterium]|nr:YgjV family protein [Clostridia bacterium]
MIIIIAQIIGYLAMLTSFLSFQMRTHRSIMLVQVITAILFAVHFLMLGKTTGCILNAAAIIRDIIFMYQDKSKFCAWRGWTVIFCIVMVVLGGVSWVTGDGFYAIFFTVAMVFNTISMSVHNPQNVRKIILIACPLAFTYDLLTKSQGGMVNEVLAACSAVIGLIRYRNKDTSK